MACWVLCYHSLEHESNILLYTPIARKRDWGECKGKGMCVTCGVRMSQLLLFIP